MPPLLGFALCGLAAMSPRLVTREEDSPESRERPNVIVILADDLGYGDLGVTGNPVIQTPHLDAMAERGARMSRFYVAPMGGPTRAALLTGRYPHRSGVDYNGAPMSAAARTLAELLQEAGYATGIFGKWHLGSHHPRRAVDQGFEECLTTPGGVIGLLAPVPAIGRYTDPFFDRNGVVESFEGYATDVLFEQCLEWIGRVHGDGRSFFAYLSTHVPHRPLEDVPLERYRALLQRLTAVSGEDDSVEEAARVYAMVENLDANVGKLFDRLEALNLTDDTLVVFLSDNGPFGERYSAGMRGSKGSVLDGGVRAPFLAAWPARIEPGHVSDLVAAHIDLVPTILEACSVSVEEELALDGHSLLGPLSGDTPAWSDRMIFLDGSLSRGASPRDHFAVRSRDWKLVRPASEERGRPGVAFGLEGLELYDMRVDPLETTDVLADHRDLAEAMGRAYWAFSSEESSMHSRGEQEDERVRVGLAEENPVILSHDNWGRVSDVIAAQSGVTWLLRCVDARLYDIVLRFAPSSEPRIAAITLVAKARRFSVRRETDVEPGVTEVAFEEVKLGMSRYELLAVVGSSRARGRPVWQAEIRWR